MLLERPFRVLILDDEADAREHLAGLLESFYPSTEVCGQCSSGRQALEMIANTKPDRLYLLRVDSKQFSNTIRFQVLH